MKHQIKVAILNANYMSHRLKDHYKTLHKGKDGLVRIFIMLDLVSPRKTQYCRLLTSS